VRCKGVCLSSLRPDVNFCISNLIDIAASLAKRDLMKIAFISSSYTSRRSCLFIPSSIILLSEYNRDICRYNSSPKAIDNQPFPYVLLTWSRQTRGKQIGTIRHPVHAKPLIKSEDKLWNI
jgi:hypothetical protein